MKRLSITLISLLFILSSFGQWNNGGTKLSSNAKALHHRPMVSVTSDGGMYVTWMATDTTSGKSAISLTKVDAAGRLSGGWPDGGKVVYNINDNQAPTVITSEDGGAIVSWYGYPTGSGNSQIYVQKYSQAGTPIWNSGTSPVLVSPLSTRIDKYPVIISDRQNGTYIAWTSYENLADPSKVDVYIQHIDSLGHVATGWSTSGTGVGVIDSVREAMPRLVLTPDKSAIYVIYNEGLSSIGLKLKKINAGDGTIAGSPWPAGGIQLSSSYYVFPDPVKDQFIFCDDENNAVIFWLDSHYDDVNYEVYMQRVSPSGMQMLAHPGGKYIGGKGIMNGGAYTGTMYFDAVRDAEDNYLLVYANYTDTTSKSQDHIDAVKVKADGTIKWQKSPLTKLYSGDHQKVVSDGNKGMYVFYRLGNDTVDLKSGNALFALGVDSLGNLYNTSPEPGAYFGAMDSYAPTNSDLDFAVAVTCPGRAMAAWDMGRLTKYHSLFGYNIYACNLLHTMQSCKEDDSPCVVSVPEIKNDADVKVFPNPFNSIVSCQLSVISNQNYKFMLYDITGKMVYSGELGVGSKEKVVSLGWLTSGMYFYEVRQQATGNRQQNLLKRGKLVKE